MAWQGSTPWIKSAFLILILANAFNLAGFVAPGWLRKYVRGGGTTDYGLWLVCYGEAMGCISAVGNELLGGMLTKFVVFYLLFSIKYT